MVVRDRRRPRLTAAIVIVLLAVLLVLAGIWRGWWGFGMAENEADNELQLQVNVDKDRIAEDAGAAAEKAKEAAQSASVAAEVQTVKGQVVSLESDRLQLQTEGQTRTFSLSEATEFRVSGEEASPEDLEPGEAVLVTYRTKDGTDSALKVERAD